MWTHVARHLMLIDICIQFREYSLSSFQVIEWTRFVTDRQTDGCLGKNICLPTLKGVDCMWTHVARHLMLIDICIQFREYSLSSFQVIEWTRFVTDRQTDRWTDGCLGKNNMSPDPEGGETTCRLMLSDICIQFREYSLNGC